MPITPSSDPTTLTTEQLRREVELAKEWIRSELGARDERFRGLDRATQLLDETVNRVPTDIQQAVSHLRELSNERLTALKEAAEERNRSNTLAIDKSEASVAESIAKLEQLFKTSIEGLSNQLIDLKERLTLLESR